MKGFYPLDEKKIIRYIRKVSAHIPFLDEKETLGAIQIKEGNVNLIFRVFSKVRKNLSVIVKQALPYAWRYPDFKMPQRRSFLETRLLKMYDSFYPGIAPVIFCFDRSMSLNVMEDLNSYITMREGLLKQEYYPGFEKTLGIFLARNAFYTSVLSLGKVRSERFKRSFKNPVMAEVTVDLVFTQPIVKNPNNRWTPGLEETVNEIRGNKRLSKEADSLRRSFINDKNTLLHSDMHTGSVMANKEGIKVIDPEFALYGPYGFDIATMLANLIISFFSQDYHARYNKGKENYKEWILSSTQNLYRCFIEELRKLLTDNAVHDLDTKKKINSFLVLLFKDVLGYMGLEIMRRTTGLAHVSDFEKIDRQDIKISVEKKALVAACQMIIQRHYYSDISEVTDTIKKI